jgi:hypothetical protein
MMRFTWSRMGLNIATGVHFITYTYTSQVSCIYSWHCGRGVWLLGSTKHFSSQIEFLLPSLLSCLIFFHHLSQSRLGWTRLRLFLARFVIFINGSTWNDTGRNMGKEAHLIVRCYYLSMLSARRDCVLYSNSISCFQSSGSSRYHWFLFSLLFLPHIFILVVLFRHLTIEARPFCYISLVHFSILSSKQHSFELSNNYFLDQPDLARDSYASFSLQC